MLIVCTGARIKGNTNPVHVIVRKNCIEKKPLKSQNQSTSD